MHKYKTHVKAVRYVGPIDKLLAKILKELFGDRDDSVLIAIGGPGGTGKSTLCRDLSVALGDASVLTLDDYKTAREFRQNYNIYGPHPDANKLSLIREHLICLKNGARFDRPVYCAEAGDARNSVPFDPGRFNILDGEVSTYREFRDLVDFAIFVDSDWRTQLQTRVSRDIDERGYSRDKAIATFLHSNLREFSEYGAESKKWADLHVHCHDNYRLEVESIAQEHFEGISSRFAIRSIKRASSGHHTLGPPRDCSSETPSDPGWFWPPFRPSFVSGSHPQTWAGGTEWCGEHH